MLPCPGCARHIAAKETTCPFCGVSQRSVFDGRPKLALVVGVALAGCGPVAGDPSAGSTSDDGSSTSSSGAPTTTTTGSDVTSTTTTTSTTTVGVSTDVIETSTGPDEGTTSSSTTDVDDSFDTCAGFYGGCPSDFSPSPYECDIWEDDCSDGEKCAAWANDGGDVWNATKCVPVDQEPDTVGDPCTVEGSFVSGVDSCEEGSICFDVNPETNEGTCVGYCGGGPDDPMCGVGECAMFDPLVLNVCLELCDPKTAEECLNGETCEQLVEGFDFYTCVPPVKK